MTAFAGAIPTTAKVSNQTVINRDFKTRLLLTMKAAPRAIRRGWDRINWNKVARITIDACAAAAVFCVYFANFCAGFAVGYTAVLALVGLVPWFWPFLALGVLIITNIGSTIVLNNLV